MNKTVPIIVLGAIAVGIFVFSQGGDTPVSDPASQKAAQNQESRGSGTLPASSGAARLASTGGSETTPPPAEISIIEDDIKPATEAFASAEEALTAVKEGAKEYDDLVLEQFVEPDSACSWCEKFYSDVNEEMLSNDISNDERSYFAELLAISGRVDNISTLVGAIEGEEDEQRKDVFAEALEMTVGNEEIVQFFGEKIATEDELLKESMLAAVTNHGSRLAIDILYQETVKNGDPDGFYSIGIGLGEIIPDDDTLPYLETLATKRDQYSHLAVKALLNQGDEGLRSVIGMLEKGEDAALDRKIIEDAVDHIAYEDGTSEYLQKIANSTQNPLVKEFSQLALEEIEALDEELQIDLAEEQG